MANANTYNLTIYFKNSDFQVRFLEFHNISLPDVNHYVKYYKDKGDGDFEFLSWESYNG